MKAQMQKQPGKQEGEHACRHVRAQGRGAQTCTECQCAAERQVGMVASDSPSPRASGNGGFGKPAAERKWEWWLRPTPAYAPSALPLEAAARDLASQTATNFLRNSSLVRIMPRTDVARAQASSNVHPRSRNK